MPRFAANLSFLFTERPFLDRFEAARAAGFAAVEILFPYDHPADAVAERLAAFDLHLALINTPLGSDGERGLAALPGREVDFARSLDTAIAYAEATGAAAIHVMSGLADPADRDANATIRRNLDLASERATAAGRLVTLEPLNGRDAPGYFLRDFTQAADLIRELARPNLRLQFDFYHRQIVHGDVLTGLRELMRLIGHVQVASVPSRNEPDGEELNHPALFAELDRLGYGGFVGCEYRPRGRTEDGLGWLAPWLEASWPGS